MCMISEIVNNLYLEVRGFKMKIKIEVEIDTKDDRDELEELIEQLENLRAIMANSDWSQDDD
jgi:hypothetical protein